MTTEYATQEIELDRRYKEGFRRLSVTKLYDSSHSGHPLTDFGEAIRRINEKNEFYARVGRQWVLKSRTVSEWEDVPVTEALDNRP